MIKKPTIHQARTQRPKRRGATALEFAMIAPAFVIVIVVCAEFARLSMMRNLAQNACYEAARFVMTEGATVADGIERANSILGRLGTTGAIVTINGADGSLNAAGDVEGEIGRNTQSITCAVEISLKDNSMIIPAYVFGDNKITASMMLRTERYRGYFDSTN